MKKLTIALTLMFVSMTFHVYYVFSPIDGVEVSEMTLSFQSSFEKYEYHRDLKALLAKENPEALKYLIHAKCDGEGCYDHGKTLVQVLIKLGDSIFSELIPNLQKKESDELLLLLSEGHEYGNFVAFTDRENFNRMFPLSFRALYEKV